MYPRTHAECKALHKVEKDLWKQNNWFRFLLGPAAKIIAAALFALILLYGCVSPSPFLKYPSTHSPMIQCSLPQLVVLASDVPRYDEPTIKASFDYWNDELGYEVFLYGGYSDELSKTIQYPNYIFVEITTEEQTERPEERGRMQPAVNQVKKCMKGSVISYIPTRINRNYYELDWLFRHEIGHALGAAHSPFQEDLMYKHIPFMVGRPPRAHPSLVKALKHIYELEELK